MLKNMQEYVDNFFLFYFFLEILFFIILFYF